jgi:hypothetical protein
VRIDSAEIVPAIQAATDTRLVCHDEDKPSSQLGILNESNCRRIDAYIVDTVEIVDFLNQHTVTIEKQNRRFACSDDTVALSVLPPDTVQLDKRVLRLMRH